MEEMNFSLPKIMVTEDKDEVVVKIWVSGMKAGDFELEVREDFLKIMVGREFKKEEEKEGFFESEWKSSSFEGEVSLPCKVVPIVDKKIYDGNIFEVRLKKVKE